MVRTELRGLSSAGLVTLRDDEVVYVAEARPEGGSASGGRSVGGKERVPVRQQKRARGGGRGSGRGVWDRDDEGVGSLAGGTGLARGRRREGCSSMPVYAESEQETDESSDGDWE